MRWGRIVGRAALALVLSCLSAASASAAIIDHRAVHGNERLRLDAFPTSPEVTKLHLARNESEALQIVVGVDTETDVCIDAYFAPKNPWTGEVLDLSIGRVGPVPVEQPSNLYEGGVGEYLDVVLPYNETGLILVPGPNGFHLESSQPPGNRSAFPYRVPAGKFTAIWVEVFAPESATPGTYKGQVAFSECSTGVSFAQDFTAEVYDVVLPPTSSMPVFAGFDAPRAYREHFGPQWTPGSATMLNEMYAHFLLQHRISISLVGPQLDPTNPDDASEFGHWAIGFRDLILGANHPFFGGRLVGASMTALEYPWEWIPNRRESIEKMTLWWNAVEDLGLADIAFDRTFDRRSSVSNWSDAYLRAMDVKASHPRADLVRSEHPRAEECGYFEFRRHFCPEPRVERSRVRCRRTV